MPARMRFPGTGSSIVRTSGMQALVALRLARRAALDFVLPPRCLACRGPLAGGDGLCPACWNAVEFLSAPLCECCGTRLEAGGPEDRCGPCLATPPRFDRARAAFVYDDASRDLVLGLKHGDRLQGVPSFGRWMARAGASLLAETDLIAPVPLHWTRLLVRRFNQSAELARAVGRASGCNVAPDLLLRRRRTPSQGGLTRRGRRRNVAGAFALHPRRSHLVAGKRILLVDDVLTTGATVETCAALLRRAGARGVDVLTLARVVRPG